MPTSEEFLAAASGIDDAVERTKAVATALASHRDGVPIVSGHISLVVQQTFDALIGSADALAGRADTLAAQLRQRAQICMIYTEMVRDYHRALSRSTGDNVPTYPTRPAPWAESSV